MKNTNKRFAFYTILDNKFVPNFLFSLWSLKKFNSLNDIDILVFSKEEISEENKNTIKLIHPYVKFFTKNRKLISHNWAFDYDLKLEVYFIQDYDTVMYFDADVLFFNGFEDIVKYRCNFGAVSYGSYFSATIMLFNKQERSMQNLERFINTYNNNKNSEHDQDIFNIMYNDYFKIPYDYNQMFTNFNINTAKCLQFPGKIKGLDKEMEKLLLSKNSVNASDCYKSLVHFKKIKKQFLKEVRLNV